MYRKNKPNKTTLHVNKTYEGETIEEKVQRILSNKEPIKDGAPLIYTDRKDGVLPQYDIRTDRFEIALDAMDKVTKSHIAKREQRAKLGEEAKKNMEIENNKDGGAKPAQATE